MDDSKREVVMLTTIDNPWNPFLNFEEWNIWDQSHGYNSNAYLARLTSDSRSMTDEEEQDDIFRAISWIVANDPTGMYTMVTK